eukprot:CAMPEP_0170325422 /NCGR_PEP_ID=MMETSP0116_2-20130129/63576_1 /TAXON_ID=400756 /ORGANISM="Durinskia baltica, Strain CSIRO CS-38" /LENGTH=125 /DNA_ID=CAMNT_0010578455 /DNA_START=160 /DNA_END=533 /DNA_ORIENTATION=-
MTDTQSARKSMPAATEGAEAKNGGRKPALNSGEAETIKEPVRKSSISMGDSSVRSLGKVVVNDNPEIVQLLTNKPLHTPESLKQKKKTQPALRERVQAPGRKVFQAPLFRCPRLGAFRRPSEPPT